MTRFSYPSIYPIKVYTWHIKITRTIYSGNDSSCSCNNIYDSGITNSSVVIVIVIIVVLAAVMVAIIMLSL